MFYKNINNKYVYSLSNNGGVVIKILITSMVTGLSMTEVFLQNIDNNYICRVIDNRNVL